MRSPLSRLAAARPERTRSAQDSIVTVVSPIHTAAVGLGNIRFFAPPSGGREFAWLSLDDALHSFRFPRGMRRHVLRDMRADWGSAVVSIPTADGPLTIVPHFCGQGMVTAMIDCGRCGVDLLASYSVASAHATSVLTAGLMPGEMADFLAAAMGASEAVSKARVGR